MNKITIRDMLRIAKGRGGKCLSKRYINIHTKLNWRCKEGHEWEATPESIKNKGSWCPHCFGNAKLTIEDMREIAREKGGVCLSEKYINAHTKLRWRCKEGHEWEAQPRNIKHRTWCPECAGKTKITIEDMKKLASSKGGECVSKEYIDTNTKLKWRCKKGHIWEAMPLSIKRGTWCPYCVGKAKLTIDEMRKIAESRGGKCLSTEYINNRTKLRWRCKAGHEWDVIPASVKHGTWCPYCAGKAKLTIDEMRKIAKERGGKCLSKRYTNAHTKLRWRCKEGHVWKAKPANINRGQWCPYCARKR